MTNARPLELELKPVRLFLGSYVEHFRRIGDLIKNRYRKNKSPKNMKSPVTFLEFVKFLLDRRTGRPLDRHWRPMHQLCSPCSVGYDFIGHYETMASDAAFVLDKLQIDPAVVQFKTSESGRRNSSDRVDKALAQLSPAQLKGLRQLYRLDFELFGYE
jgi:Sulfotransferase family